MDDLKLNRRFWKLDPDYLMVPLVETRIFPLHKKVDEYALMHSYTANQQHFYRATEYMVQLRNKNFEVLKGLLRIAREKGNEAFVDILEEAIYQDEELADLALSLQKILMSFLPATPIKKNRSRKKTTRKKAVKSITKQIVNAVQTNNIIEIE